MKEGSPFCLTRAITRAMIGPCYAPLSGRDMRGLDDVQEEPVWIATSKAGRANPL